METKFIVMAEHAAAGSNKSAQINSVKECSKNNDFSKTDTTLLQVTKTTSLCTLIIWNISKALENNPSMDIKGAIKAAQVRLDRERDLNAVMSRPEERHLACAILAWQQLGHSDAESLYQFIETERKKRERSAAVLSTSTQGSIKSLQESNYSKDLHSISFGSASIGPVVRLPEETKIVMRMENSTCARHSAKKPKAQDKDTLEKIDAACCLDSACVERLAAMDTATTELRMRAGMLARREAERVELLERAEAAWKDLELGYQRRLTLAEEKEDDLTKQIQKTIEERNSYKNSCTVLATQLREKGEKAEKDRASLSMLEKEVCDRACTRLRLSEESAKGDAILAEHQCRAAQLDRDLQFKEEHARRKLLNFQSELESSQTITHDTERAMRAELGALREQIMQVSEQLLAEDAENSQIRNELEELRLEKMGMVEDLEGCKAMCDSRMQGKTDELKKKTDQLTELKDRVMECRCKLPVDVTVEVKRTASLAALCRCTPEDKILESCSCTSLRSKLLSNLLADLFHGLQSEMGGTGTQMPCQLLKCLEDKHNWDRASIVKTNLKNYFDQLLIGELDIAIATSIEKYHAKWVGQSCADVAKMTPDPGEAETEGWQERAIERRAQKLAAKLAEQLFQERADQLTQQAKDIVASGPPPCECKPQHAVTKGCKEGAAVYPVLIQQVSPAIGSTIPVSAPDDWRRAMRDVSQLRVQIENLKKESIKKEDLKSMEEKLTKIVQESSGPGKSDMRVHTLNNSNIGNSALAKREPRYNRSMGLNQLNYYSTLSKPVAVKKKQAEISSFSKKGVISNSISTDKYLKPFKKHGQTYAINMCMCAQKDPTKTVQQNKNQNDSITEEDKYSRKERVSKDVMLNMSSSVKHTKPINSSLQSQDVSIRSNSKSSDQQSSCQSNCVCFHKVPSNTSIDKLLETLAKWKNEMTTLENVIEDINDVTCCTSHEKKINENKLHKHVKSEKNLNKSVSCEENVNINETSCSIKQKESIYSNMQDKFAISKISPQTNLVESPERAYDNHTQSKKKINCDSCTKTSKKPNQNDNVIKSNRSNLSKEVCCGSKMNTDKSSTETDFVIPRTTESEYMGAINLDKSNEDFCKCINNNGNATIIPDESIDCITTKKCCCKALKTKSEKYPPDGALDMSLNKSGQEKNNQSITSSLQNNMIFEESKSVELTSNKTKINTQLESFPCDCGYDIQFLGVTLTDVNPRNQIGALHDDQGAQSKEKSHEKCCYKSACYKNIECELNNNIKNNNMAARQKNLYENVEYGKLESGESDHDGNNEPAGIKQKKLKDKVNILDKNISSTNKKSKEIKKTARTNVKCDLDDFNNNITQVVQHKNEDKSVDVQSLNGYKNKKESCICCDNQLPVDDSKDLEENAFQLLEDHLKNKLEKLKNFSCNSTCIPPEEEERLFSNIIQRVKQVISDSTNKLACKCSNDEQKSAGSWNRAYALLQEYLKTKIKRVQCSCVLPDNNDDTVLPELLGKVCNLIENDFQRLQDVCDCKNSLGLQDKYNKQVYFKDELPERDTDLSNRQFKEFNIDAINSCHSQNPQTSTILKENISSQVSAYLGMETKSCNPIETYTKIIQTLEQAQESLKSMNIQDCNCSGKNLDAELLGTEQEELSNKTRINKKESPQFSNIPYVGYVSECVCKGTECTDTARLAINNDITGMVNIGQKYGDAELLGFNKSKQSPETSKDSKYLCNKTKSSPCCEMKENIKIDNVKSENNLTCDNIAHFPNNPYIGYTIDCSCDGALGTCVCTKSFLNSVNNNAINNLWKKYMPNDQYYDKVSYILKSNPRENKIYEIDVINDVYLNNTVKDANLNDDPKTDCETEISNREDETIILKNSREYCQMAHIMTNTMDDDMSVDTDYSNTEAPLDWCDCCSQIPHQDMNSDQLKHSIYFPVPLEDLDNHLGSDIEKAKKISMLHAGPKYCDCDMVPICHVKMLVENIENKLVTAKCTCDSMNPKVCPIHSLRLSTLSMTLE